MTTPLLELPHAPCDIVETVAFYNLICFKPPFATKWLARYARLGSRPTSPPNCETPERGAWHKAERVCSRPLRSLVRVKRLTSRRRIPDDPYAKLIFHADVDPA